MSVSFHIVSIGCLSRNRFWNEAQAVRPSHATTTLIRSDDKTILVDPSLPGELLGQVLHQRTGLRPEQIDVVFLTCFRPNHRRGLDLFPHAEVVMGEKEIESVGTHLVGLIEGGLENPDARALVESEQQILGLIKPARDRMTPQVHLFPAYGATAGSCALLLTPPARTVAVAGDAVLTADHYDAGMVFEHSFDTAAAKESLTELIEIADAVVPGHDNVYFPQR